MAEIFLANNYLTGKSGSRTLSLPTISPGSPFSFTVVDEMVRLYGASFTSWTLMMNNAETDRGLGKSSVQLT